MTGYHRTCCCDLTCYCGVACVGCSSSCDPTPAEYCITESVWDAYIGDVAGTGSGLVIEIDGIWYFFDGTMGPCGDIAPRGLINWTDAYRSDECPEGCERSLTITWTGSVSYGIACCVAIPGTPDQYYFDAAGTGTQTAKESPTMTLDGDCLDQNENTALEYMTAGTSCGENFVGDVTDENFRLNFRLERDETNCVWVIRVSGGGTMQGYVPNEAAGTGWVLRWTAPLSLCPPTMGWTLDEAGSTLPIEQTPDCDAIGYVTEFTVGTVTINYA